jgi:hypothetical protein
VQLHRLDEYVAEITASLCDGFEPDIVIPDRDSAVYAKADEAIDRSTSLARRVLAKGRPFISDANQAGRSRRVRACRKCKGVSSVDGQSDAFRRLRRDALELSRERNGPPQQGQ